MHAAPADARPLLIFVTYTGIGDLLMALPLFGTLRPAFRVLPLIPPSQADIARLLYQDDLLEGYLLVEESLKFYRNPLGHLFTCCALSHLHPHVVVIYGKQMFAYGARFGLLQADRVLFCHPRGMARRTTSGLEILAPTGNQSRDYLQFAERLQITVTQPRVRLSGNARERLRREAQPLINWPSYAVIAPWTRDPRRDAPARFFRECIELTITEGHLPVVITGFAQHRVAALNLLRGLPDKWVSNLVGMTTLENLLGLFAGAQFLLTNDGGSLHLAQLVGTSTIAAFGPTAPEQRLYNPSDGLVTLRLGLACSPCVDTALRYRCPGAYLQCLRDLDPAQARQVLLAACRSASEQAL